MVISPIFHRHRTCDPPRYRQHPPIVQIDDFDNEADTNGGQREIDEEEDDTIGGGTSRAITTEDQTIFDIPPD